MLKHILPMLASAPHQTYCEPFFGGGAVFFAMPPRKTEIINDLDKHLFNFYLALKHHPAELMRLVRLLPRSRDLFFHHRRIMLDPDASAVDRAAAYLYCNKHSFGGDNNSFAVGRNSPRSCFNYRRLIPHLARRMDRVAVESIDALRCISLYDSQDTIFFVDPPYTAGTIKHYDLFTGANMADLIKLLRSIRGGYILTVNDCQVHRKLLSGLRCRIVQSKYCLDKGKNNIGKRELIVTNLPFSKLSILP